VKSNTYILRMEINDLQAGKAGEYLVCADLIVKGYVAFPSEQGLPFDVVLDVEGRLLRVQVKTTRRLRPLVQRKRPISAYQFNIKRCGKGNKKMITDYCGKEFERPAGNFKSYVKHHFCSKQCSYDWWAVNGLHGEDHPHWMGGYSPVAYRYEWEKIKKLIKTRANNKCEICGGTHKCMDVHHLIPIRTGVDIKIINHLNNLQYLCRPCHVVADRKLRGIDLVASYDFQNEKERR